MVIKTKKTAIKHLLKGANFNNRPFDEFRDDKEIVVLAINLSVWAFEGASERLQDDREVVMLAVKKNGRALYHASKRLKDDKEIVLIAIKTWSLALEWVSDRLKDDKDVVLEAVRDSEWPILAASDELRKLCEGKDPFITIETEIKRLAAEKLSNELQRKPQNQTSRVFKI